MSGALAVSLYKDSEYVFVRIASDGDEMSDLRLLSLTGVHPIEPKALASRSWLNSLSIGQSTC